jgi:hypothetical protein
MCNDYGNYVDYADYLAAFSQTRIPVKMARRNPEPPTARGANASFGHCGRTSGI